ncbi:DUF5119 domain-containing protein [Parabacteroides sp. GYB001]|uniref:DUF5119 domain-containing protein n=1 Tax=Parabacteroides leei TaxID=2939491 RepID=UPI0020183403|nr:DUF5119 domain-containing protein [Parabacteroides leei]MCL3850353.1 DUF5119 domain-containing protein [Parabacteroides leei]
MKKQQYIKCIKVVAIVCIVLLPACTYRLTDEDWAKNGKIRLSLNWQDKDHPSVMTYYFYKDGADRPIIRQGQSSGYEGTLPSGNYGIVVCAADDKSVLLEMNKGYENSCGIARQVSAMKSSDIQVAQPGYLYGTGDELSNIGGFRAVTKELFPVSLVRILELNIKITGGGEDRIESLTGLLTGISSEIHIPTGKLLFDKPASMAFGTQPGATGVYNSSLNLFGVSGVDEGSYTDVDIYLTLKTSDDKEITSFTNITEVINDAFEATLAVRIVLDLEIAYDEINGMVVTNVGWKEGTGEVDAPGN